MSASSLRESSFKRLQNLTLEAQATGGEFPNTKKRVSEYEDPPEGNNEQFLTSKLFELQRELKNLKQDIATFYSMTVRIKEALRRKEHGKCIMISGLIQDI